MNKTHGVGVIVGRFQVANLSKAHFSLIRYVLNLHNNVLLFLGVSPTNLSRKNPLSFTMRQKMIAGSFSNANHKLIILPIKDIHNSKKWVGLIEDKIQEIFPHETDVTYYGGRDSSISSFLAFGNFPAIQLNKKDLELYDEKENLSGTELRDLTSKKEIDSPDFRSGVIYATYNHYDIAYPCVDIAVRHPTNPELFLFAKKPYESGLRFVGGHVNPSDYSLEEAASRELEEETGLIIPGLIYLGSSHIRDWRYEHENDKIITTLFYGVASTDAVNPQDDIEHLEWRNIETIEETDIVLEHHVLFEKLLKFYK